MTYRTGIKRMPIYLAGGKYYTRIRWGNDRTGRGAVKFPLNTDEKLVAEHRRDTIQDTSLRGKIIRAYDEHGPAGVKKIKNEIDWLRRSGTLVDISLTLSQAISEYGQYCMFNGNKCTHGNKPNKTSLTRVSFDFRVIPISKYNPDIFRQLYQYGPKVLFAVIFFGLFTGISIIGLIIGYPAKLIFGFFISTADILTFLL